MQPNDPIDLPHDEDGGFEDGSFEETHNGKSLQGVSDSQPIENTPLNPYAVTQRPSLQSQVKLAFKTPRWWTSIAIAAISLIVFIFFSTVMAVVALYVVHGRVDMALLRDTKAFLAVSESRIGLFILVVIPQIALVGPAIAAAFLSPVETRERLSLVRGRWPVWAWVGAAFATPLVGLISSVLVGLVMEESESLKTMTDIFRNHGESGFLIPLALMIGLTPAICEEVLFRGYIQTRLARSLGPVTGILIASLMFAAFHLDVVHVIAVFPLGFYLGLVVWRSGSLFPAMIGHFINNAISVFAVVFAPKGNADTLEAPAAIFSLSILIFGIMGFTCFVLAWSRFGPPESKSVTVTVTTPPEPTITSA